MLTDTTSISGVQVRPAHLIPVMPSHLTGGDSAHMGDDPVLYQIRVKGHLGPTVLTAFPGFVPRQQGGDTLLTGLVADTAALFGVLSQIEALGLDLLELSAVPTGAQDIPGTPGRRPGSP